MASTEDGDNPVTRADYYVLEFLAKVDGVQTPKCIAPNIGPPDGYNQKYVGTRCRHLADLGLVEKTERGMYKITDRGRDYLEGRIDDTDLATE